MKDTDPLTPEEMKAAADQFFPLLRIVQEGMPPESSTEETLKVMEHVAKLAQRIRKEENKKLAAERFGFVNVSTELLK
jgi:hypothetical protein